MIIFNEIRHRIVSHLFYYDAGILVQNMVSQDNAILIA